MRLLALLALAPVLILSWAAPAAAQQQRLTGREVCEEGVLLLETADGQVPLRGPQQERLALFCGLQVTLDGERTDEGAFEAAAIASPREALVTLRRERDAAGAVWLVTDGGERYRPLGRAELVGSERSVVLAWLIEAPGDDAPTWALVEAVEVETTGWWTLLRDGRAPFARPTGLIRGPLRSAWLLERTDGWSRIRRGGRTGWVRADRVGLPELAPLLEEPSGEGAARGLSGHVPD